MTTNLRTRIVPAILLATMCLIMVGLGGANADLPTNQLYPALQLPGDCQAAIDYVGHDWNATYGSTGTIPKDAVHSYLSVIYKACNGWGNFPVTVTNLPVIPITVCAGANGCHSDKGDFMRFQAFPTIHVAGSSQPLWTGSCDNDGGPCTSYLWTGACGNGVPQWDFRPDFP